MSPRFSKSFGAQLHLSGIAKPKENATRDCLYPETHTVPEMLHLEIFFFLQGLLQKNPLGFEDNVMVNEFSPSPLNDLKIFIRDIWGCCSKLGSVATFNAGNEQSKRPGTSRGKAIRGCDVTAGLDFSAAVC